MTQTLQIECTGYSIAADWYEGAHMDRILLVLPGYTSRKSRQTDFTSAIVKQTGMSALVIDYSGHGESPFELGNTRPAQHFLEVVCAFDWLKAQYPEAKISIVGNSYGSFLGAGLTSYRPIKKLVLRAPAIFKPESFYTPWSVRLADEEAYRAEINPYRKNAALLQTHPFLAQASTFKGKTLVVVHEHDESIHPQTTDAYIKAFHADSFIAKGFNHAVNQSPITPGQLAGYQTRIADWLKG